MGRGGTASCLMLRSLPLIADFGLVGEGIGLCVLKKLDLRRPGEGEGGICAKVSTVRSDKDGRGFRCFEIALVESIDTCTL